MENKCVNCASELHGKFCSNCGEKVYEPKDKHISHLLGETLHFLTHFEGKFLITLKTIFTKPGKLSLDYCSGIRKKYFKPASFYFLLVVIYLLFPLARGLNSPFSFFAKLDDSALAKRTIINKQAVSGLTIKELEEKYEKKSAAVSKFMLIIILPLCALVLKLMFFRRTTYFFDHFILSAEINSMFVISVFMLLPIAGLPFKLFLKTNENYFELVDSVASAIVLVIVATYSTTSFMRMFGLNRLKAGIFGLLFGIAQIMIVFHIYRNVLFHTVMALI